MKIVWTKASLAVAILAVFITLASRPLAIAQIDIPSPEPQFSQYETVQLVNKFIDQWSSPMLSGSGWLHVVEEHHRGLEDVGALPNGHSIPINYINDSWYLLDTEGRVIKAVVYMKTLDGHVSQESVFDGKRWENITTGDVIVRGPYRLSLDFGLSQDISRGPEAYDEVSSRYLVIGSKPALAVLAREDFDAPTHVAGMTASLVSIKTEAYFDKESGEMLSIKRIGVGADGKEYEIEFTTFQTLERSSPPLEVLALISEVSK